jgi:hypothetical protein
MKKVNIKSFWNGTIMSDLTFTIEQYNKIVQEELTKDFFKGCDNIIDEFIEVMNHKEECFAQEYAQKSHYEVGDMKTQMIHMLGINSIVKRGIRPNDDKFGVITLKF